MDRSPLLLGGGCLYLCFVLSVFELALGCSHRFARQGAPGAAEEAGGVLGQTEETLSPSCDGAGRTLGESGRPRKALGCVS